MTDNRLLACIFMVVACAVVAGCSNGSSAADATTVDGSAAECVSKCAGRECGPDPGGCAKDCGTCPSSHLCGASGKCECVKTCGDAQCGPDGCGGECGVCGQGEQCGAEGECESIECGDVECPPFPGPGTWNVYCNEKDHCEYSCIGACQPGIEIFVPSSAFPMGSAEDGSECAQLDFPDACAYEHPIHDVAFSFGYFVDKLEVTNSQYSACIASGTCSRPDSGPWKKVLDGMDIDDYDQAYEKFPVVGLSWAQAVQYCVWLGKELPSEARWERAASGLSHQLFPWGDNKATADMAVYCHKFTLLDDCVGFSVEPVGSRPKGLSPVGAMDMAGNAAEFVEDCFHGSYQGAPVDGEAHITGCEQPPMPYPVGEDEIFRIARGGSAAVPAVGIRTSAREPINEATSSETVGFRCSRDADKP